MSEPLPRFTRVLNMQVIRMTAAEAAEAQRRFDEDVAAAERRGAINIHNFETMYKTYWAAAHHGADSVETVPDGTLLEPLP